LSLVAFSQDDQDGYENCIMIPNGLDIKSLGWLSL